MQKSLLFFSRLYDAKNLCSSFPGCMMAIALGRESIENQNRLAHADCFSQLVRLLRRHKSSTKVMLMVIKVLGILCVGKLELKTASQT